MESLSIITSIAVVLLIGLIITIISKKIKVSNVLLLIISGMILKLIMYKGEPAFEFSPSFLVAISILALVMITFDGSSKFKLKELDAFSNDAVKTVFWFVIMNAVILTAFTNVLFFPGFSIKNIILPLIFAVMMAGTDPGTIFAMMKYKLTRVIEVLEIEAIINTPIIVIIPFILLDFLSETIGGEAITSFLDQLAPFLKQIIVGIGAGVVVGIIIFKAMRKFYHHDLSPYAIITAALIAYILAENLDGNGVLSVATLGLFFGNSHLKNKISMQEFSSIFSSALQILVFVLTGFLIRIEWTQEFLAKSLLLFAVLIITRWIAVNLALKKSDYKPKEKIFMVLNIPKGIAVVAVVFSLSVRNIIGIEKIIDLTLIFVIYSLILSSVVNRYVESFIRVEPKD